ncbi:helix-turn-helix transcriptional regulator [soil metagenome]
MTLVLVILRDGRRHGYDIAKEVERRSQAQLTFNHGTLYPMLYVLEDRGLIASDWVQPTGERRRREYYLTPEGETESDKAIKEWYAYAEAMHRVIEKG